MYVLCIGDKDYIQTLSAWSHQVSDSMTIRESKMKRKQKHTLRQPLPRWIKGERSTDWSLRWIWIVVQVWYLLKKPPPRGQGRKKMDGPLLTHTLKGMGPNGGWDGLILARSLNLLPHGSCYVWIVSMECGFFLREGKGERKGATRWWRNQSNASMLKWMKQETNSGIHLFYLSYLYAGMENYIQTTSAPKIKVVYPPNFSLLYLSSKKKTP